MRVPGNKSREARAIQCGMGARGDGPAHDLDGRGLSMVGAPEGGDPAVAAVGGSASGGAAAVDAKLRTMSAPQTVLTG